MGGIKKVYIPVAEVARILEWDGKSGKQRAIRWLISANAAVKINGRWYTTRERLKDSFPDIYEEIQIQKFERDD